MRIHRTTIGVARVTEHSPRAGSPPSCTTISDISTTKPAGSTRLPTPSAQKCYLCRRYKTVTCVSGVDLERPAEGEKLKSNILWERADFQNSVNAPRSLRNHSFRGCGSVQSSGRDVDIKGRRPREADAPVGQKLKSSMFSALNVVSSAWVLIELFALMVMVPRFGTSKVGADFVLDRAVDDALGEVRRRASLHCRATRAGRP